MTRSSLVRTRKGEAGSRDLTVVLVLCFDPSSDKQVVQALLDISRMCFARFDIEPPQIIQLEREIAEEEMRGPEPAEPEPEAAAAEEPVQESLPTPPPSPPPAAAAAPQATEVSNDGNSEATPAPVAAAVAADDSSASSGAPVESAVEDVVAPVLPTGKPPPRYLPYKPFPGDALDKAVALLVNSNQLDIFIKRSKAGQYFIGQWEHAAGIGLNSTALLSD